MANPNVFSSASKSAREPDTINQAGGTAHAFGPKHALAQLAATGCFNDTYYAQGSDQLDALKSLIQQVDDNGYIAKLAVYSRERGAMKDMPAALCAALASRDTELFHKVFDRVINNGRVLRTLFQMIRSGQFGKKSLSASVQRAFQRWLLNADVGKLLSASIGDKPSLRDVLRLARPTPKTQEQRAFFGWLVDKPPEKWGGAYESNLPDQVRLLQEFRKAETEDDQLTAINGGLEARWDLLASAAKGPRVWTAIAKNMGYQALRMNLNTLQRHGVFDAPGMVSYVAEYLADPKKIEQAKQLPYQMFSAYLFADDTIPQKIKAALQQAAEVACGNVPKLDGPILIGVDVSGSMSSPVTGNRGAGSTSKMRCVDVAALFAAAMLRANPDSVVVPFDTVPHKTDFDPGDTILSIAKRLASYGGGGTDCSIPLRVANERYRTTKFIGAVLVSDNESWRYAGRSQSVFSGHRTGTMAEWTTFQAYHPGAKLCCIDLEANTHSQAPEGKNVLNVGGFSDAVFDVVSGFLSGDNSRFVAAVESVSL